jgi:hypothetical protein
MAGHWPSIVTARKAPQVTPPAHGASYSFELVPTDPGLFTPTMSFNVFIPMPLATFVRSIHRQFPIFIMDDSESGVHHSRMYVLGAYLITQHLSMSQTPREGP